MNEKDAKDENSEVESGDEDAGEVVVEVACNL
jgi:hypothetical protein